VGGGEPGPPQVGQRRGVLVPAELLLQGARADPGGAGDLGEPDIRVVVVIDEREGSRCAERLANSLSAALSQIQVRSARPGSLVLLDLSGLDFCDISGLNAMAAVRRRLAQRGTQHALVAPRRNFMRLLKAAMLSGYFEVLPSLPAARAS